MATKVAKVGVKKEDGWLYYLDKKGNVSRAKMGRGRKPSKVKPQMVAKVGVKREEGFLYFIDKQGDVSKAKLSRRGRKKKRK
ncbi:MAG: hypothetical protein EBR01_08090 [Proteobacteria bacterium]|nr:hypothetical protein [Pseudomonadota bacterium]NBY19999.1 hypothetical protein [bacterium]